MKRRIVMAFCTACGTALADGSFFCTGCGANLSAAPAAESPPEQPLAPEAQIPPPEELLLPAEPIPLPDPTPLPELAPPPPPEPAPLPVEAPPVEPPVATPIPIPPPVPIPEPMMPLLPPPPEPLPLPVQTAPILPPEADQDTSPAKGSRFAVMGVWKYIGVMLLFCLPVIGLIFCIAWSASSRVNRNLRNLSRAYLTLSIVSLVLVFVGLILMIVLFSSVFWSAFQSGNWNELLEAFY